MRSKSAGETRESVRIVDSPVAGDFRLEASVFLPRSRDEVFEFFSDAVKLQILTPKWLHFSVLTSPPIHMQPEALINYRLRVRGIPIFWQSRISKWEPPLCFVDEQTRGPYRKWHHEHTFEEADGGTLCRDTVDYSVYGGALVNALFVRPDLLKIFAFRQGMLRELFPPLSVSTRTDPIQASSHS